MKNWKSATPKPASIEVHIEELVLHGFAPGDRHRIGEAVQHELKGLLDLHGVPPALAKNRNIDSLDCGSFKLKPSPSGKTTGHQIARALHRGLNG